MKNFEPDSILKEAAFRNGDGILHVFGRDIPITVTTYTQSPLELDRIECTVKPLPLESMMDEYCRRDVELTRNLYHNMFNSVYGRNSACEIVNVIFNDPATIVFWSDGTKTVVKCQEYDTFDPEKGLAMAIAKKALGNKGSYYNTIKKWTEPWYEEEKAMNCAYHNYHDSMWTAIRKAIKDFNDFNESKGADVDGERDD